MMHETEDVAGKKIPVKGGCVCIYCGWDGGEKGLRDEHTVPFSLGGNTELLNASCVDCEAITSYLDGYMANAIFGHLRVHIDLQSRSGHPATLPATIELADGQRAVELATGDHLYFLNLPIWGPPGFMVGKQLSEGFGNSGRFSYWYVPPKFRDVIGLKDGDVARITERTSHLADHGGQISFPGGKIDPGDESPAAAALCEAEEEIALSRRFVEPIGYLDIHLTPFGHRIMPV